MIPTLQSVGDASAPPSLVSESPSMEPLPPLGAARNYSALPERGRAGHPEAGVSKKYFAYFEATSFFL